MRLTWSKRTLLLSLLCLCPLWPSLAQDAPLTDAQKSRVTPVVTAYRKARPAVVSISAQKVVQGGAGLFGGDPLDEIFPSPLRPRAVQSLGSGVLIHPQGYIVTNAHVIRRAQKVTVTLQDNTPLEARVISADDTCDLAVLKVEPSRDKTLPFLPLGRSDDLIVGETVIAIGNPFGYSNSVTAGVVSAVDRKLEFASGVTCEQLIQTDAPINPGNSGGPLLNINGEFIGINSAIRADGHNIGFAIPVDVVAARWGSLLDFERINRVVLGASLKPQHGEKGDQLVVAEVRKDTPADGKLAKGDVVLSVNKTPVHQITDYTCLMLSQKADTPMTLTVQRAGKEQAVELKMLAKPKPDGKAMAIKLMGLTLRAIDKETAEDLGLAIDSGLLVVDVEKGSPGEKIGMRKKDVLFQVAQFYVKSLDDLGTLLEDLPAGASIKIGIIRGNVAAWAAMKTGQGRR